jgi:DNA repair photolyase
MKIISFTTGRAKEFALIALNIFKGCLHRCRYCFAPNTLWKRREEFYASANPKDNVLEKLSDDIKTLKRKFKDETPEIHLSFLGDVYQPEEMKLRLTRESIKLLIENDLPFTILTKGGSRALRDFDLLEGYPRCSFGTTLVFWNQSDADYWEPGAASVEDRKETIMLAKAVGVRTWVSLEPVIDPEQALKIVEELYPYVDHWKIGKLNYHKAIEDKVDWIGFREQITLLLKELNADYYLKKSLTDL